MNAILKPCVCLSLLVSPAALVGQAPVTFQLLDSLVAPYATATGVSDDGTTVIGNFQPPGSMQHGYRLRIGSPFEDLGVLPNHNTSDANGVNADGSVVIGNSSLSGPIWTLPLEATRSANGSNYVTLGFLAGDNFSMTTGVDASGDVIVGQSGGGPNGGPAIWLNTLPFALPPLSYFSTLPIAVDDVGTRVIGNANTATGNQAVMWTGAGLANIAQLPALPGFTNTYALAISGDGNTVIGRSWVGSVLRNVRWTNGVPAELEEPLYPNPGQQWRILCANGDCTLLGGSGSFPPPYAPRVMLYKQGRGWIDVHDLLARLGVNLGGLTLASITGISNDGATIVGETSSAQYYVLRNLPLNGFQERLDGCGVGVSIYHYGRPSLGQTFGIQITTPGLPVIAAGAPVTTPFPGCASCVIGAIDFLFATNSLQVAVPINPALSGLQLTFQGAGVGGGVLYPCTGNIKVTRAVDVTIQ